MIKCALATPFLVLLSAATPASAATWVKVTESDTAVILLDLDSLRSDDTVTGERGFPVVQAMVKYDYVHAVYSTLPDNTRFMPASRVELESVDCKTSRVATLSFAEYSLLESALKNSATREDRESYYTASPAGSVGERLARLICGVDAIDSPAATGQGEVKPYSMVAGAHAFGRH